MDDSKTNLAFLPPPAEPQSLFDSFVQGQASVRPAAARNLQHTGFCSLFASKDALICPFVGLTCPRRLIAALLFAHIADYYRAFGYRVVVL